MKVGFFITEAEEADLRENHGYNDEEIALVNRAAETRKAAEELRAMAAHSAWHRQHPRPEAAA